MPRKTRARWILLLLILLLVGGLLDYAFFLSRRSVSAEDFSIHGFDVSHHQGDIQWNKISPQRYQFVYLKATEGGDFKDPKFQDNWLKARERGLHVGAYHFYRLCRDGKIQADNFIATVPKRPDALAPVIDLEYDNQCINHYTKEQLLQQIKTMHDRLHQHYGKAPIFYVSRKFYNIVLIGQFQQTPIWLREYRAQPKLKDGREWLFWQYTAQGKIDGINKAVDLNVYAGSAREWRRYLKHLGIQADH